MVETWNGSAWSHVIAPPASDVAPADWLFSVSCATVASCVAVGYFFTLRNGGGADGLIETLAHGAWSASPIPSPGGDVVDSFLDGVSCTSPTSCVAVGYTLSKKFVARPLIIALAHGSWSIMPSPSLGSELRWPSVGVVPHSQFVRGRRLPSLRLDRRDPRRVVAAGESGSSCPAPAQAPWGSYMPGSMTSRV